jgi:hypothetical protein
MEKGDKPLSRDIHGFLGTRRIWSNKIHTLSVKDKTTQTKQQIKKKGLVVAITKW